MGADCNVALVCGCCGIDIGKGIIIASRLILSSGKTHWKRKADGTHLCFFCKRDLTNHAHCKKCSILIHHPNDKYPEAVQATSQWTYEKRLCRSCHQATDPHSLIYDIAEFLESSSSLGQVDIPEIPFR